MFKASKRRVIDSTRRVSRFSALLHVSVGQFGQPVLDVHAELARAVAGQAGGLPAKPAAAEARLSTGRRERSRSDALHPGQLRSGRTG
jgi:hypothetical protein